MCCSPSPGKLNIEVFSACATVVAGSQCLTARESDLLPYSDLVCGYANICLQVAFTGTFFL